MLDHLSSVLRVTHLIWAGSESEGAACRQIAETQNFSRVPWFEIFACLNIKCRSVSQEEEECIGNIPGTNG